MKKRLPLLLLALALALLAGCQKQEKPVELPAEEPVEEPLRIETLRVEISKNGLDTQTLMAAVKELPDLLEEAFAKTDVEVDSVKVTVGASPADTAKALSEGRIDLGFLPAEGYLTYGGGANVLLADEGTTGRLYAVPTAYGKQLSARADGGTALSWTELANARWGVLETAHDCLDLWLAEEYEGRTLADLPDVTAFDSTGNLLQAAAGEEIDLLVCVDALQEELPLLVETGTLYSHLAAAAPELTDRRFAVALETVLDCVGEEAPERMTLFGAVHFTAVTDDELASTRRLLELST